jgi:hypothetical protein
MLGYPCGVCKISTILTDAANRPDLFSNAGFPILSITAEGSLALI